MSPDSLVAKWNESHARIPKDKDASTYAREREAIFPRHARVADLGGGTGADAMLFMQQGHIVDLVDIAPVALARAQERAQELGLSDNLHTHEHTMGLQPIPLPDSSEDVVYSRLVYHFLSPKELIFNLREAQRILANGGVAYITLKSFNDAAEMASLLERATKVAPGVYDEDGQMKYRFDKDQLVGMLKENGIFGEVREYTEIMGGRNDVVKSGNSEMLLNEIVIHKS